MKTKTVCIISLILVGLGVMDVIFRIYYLDWVGEGFSDRVKEGLNAVANDPGKDFFHIFILPALTFVLLTLPVSSTRILNCLLNRPSFIFVAVIILVTATCYTFSQAKEAFTSTLESPEDIADKTSRKEYAEYRQNLRDEVQNQKIIANEARDLAYQRGRWIIAGKPCNFHVLLIPGDVEPPTNQLSLITVQTNVNYSFWIFNASGQLVASRTNLSGCSKDISALTNAIHGDQTTIAAAVTYIANYPPLTRWECFEKASWRRHLATTLMLFGNVIAGWLFFVVCVIYSHEKRLSEFERDSLLMMIALFSLWLPLRLYSEWYHQFFATEIDNSPLRVGAVLAIAATLVAYVKASKNILPTVAPGAISLISAGAVIFFQSKLTAFIPIAKFYRDIQWPERLVYIVIFIIALGTMFVHVYRNIQSHPEEITAANKLARTKAGQK